MFKTAFTEYRGHSIYVAVVLVAAVLNLAMGGDPVILALALAGMLLSVLPSYVMGGRDVPAIFCLAVGALYDSSSIIYKTITLTGVQKDLYNPLVSFEVVLLGIATMVAAAFLARWVLPTKPLFKERYTEGGLQFIAVLGGVMMAVNFTMGLLSFIPLGGINEISGTGSTMLPVCWLAYNILRGKPPVTRTLAVFVLGLGVLALAFNSRQSVLQPFTAGAFFFISFRIPVSIRALAIGAITAGLFVVIVSPVMLATRYLHGMVSPLQIMSVTIEAATSPEAFKKATASLDRAQAISKFIDKFNRYRMTYTEGSGEFVSRFVEIQPMDILVGYAQQFGPIGTKRFWRGVVELLPSALVPDKTVVHEGAYALWVYGLITWGKQWNPTLTMFGDAYSYGGFPFVAEACFAIFFIVFAPIRCFCPRLENSVLAAFFVASYIHVMTESSLLGVLGIPTREFFIELFLFWVATKIKRPLFRFESPQQPRTAMPGLAAQPAE